MISPSKQSSRMRRYVGGFLKISTGTMISRVTGLFREILLAFYLGSSAAMDAFLVAFTLPNLFRRVLGEKVMESAFLPVYKTLRDKGTTAETATLVKTILVVAIGTATIIVAAGIGLAPVLVHVFAPGFDPETHYLAVTMTRVMFPFLTLICAASILGSILLAHERLWPYSLAPVLFNISFIAVVWLGVPRFGSTTAAWAVLIGGALEFMIMIPFVPRLFLKTGSLQPASAPARKTYKLTGPLLLDTVLEKTVVLVDRRLASFLSTGSIAALGYAFRLLQLPYGVLALAVSRTVYPSLVESAGDIHRFKDRLEAGLRFLFVLIMPITALIFVLGTSLVRLIYHRGAFDDRATAMTGIALACYSLGLMGMAGLGLITRAFNALLDTLTPVIVSAGLTVLNIILNYILVRTSLKHAGVALASAIAYSTAAVALFILLERKMSARIHTRVHLRIGTAFFKTLAAAAAAGAVMMVIRSTIPFPMTWMGALLLLLSAGIPGAAVYLLVLRMTGLNPGSVFHSGQAHSDRKDLP